MLLNITPPLFVFLLSFAPLILEFWSGHINKLRFISFPEDSLALRDPTFSGLKTKQNRIPKKSNKTRKIQLNTEISNTHKKYQISDLLFFVRSLKGLGLGGCMIIITKILSLGTSYYLRTGADCNKNHTTKSPHQNSFKKPQLCPGLHFTE